MGRTLPPYSRNIRTFEERMAGYRRALRRSDQLLFDELMNSVLVQTAAGAMAASPEPEAMIFLSMALELKREIHDLRKRLPSEEPGPD